MSLKNLRNNLLETQLSFLWNCWSSLGIAGYEEQRLTSIIDPEALLLYTLDIARYDNRLYDELFDWCKVNGQFLSIARIKSLLKKNKGVERQVGVLAALISQQTHNKKWATLKKMGSNPSNTNHLFSLKDGSALPIINTPDPLFLSYGLLRDQQVLRSYSHPFDPSKASAFILKLRSLMGISVRCEIITALMDGSEKNPSLIAREMGYYQKTVQDTIIEMVYSGIVSTRQNGREKLYRLEPHFIASFELAEDIAIPSWSKFDNCKEMWRIVDQATLKELPISTLLHLLNNKFSDNNFTNQLRSEDDIVQFFNNILFNK